MSKNYEFGRKNSDFCLRVMSFFVRTKAQAQAQANAQGDLLSIRFELGFSFEGLGVWGSGVAPS